MGRSQVCKAADLGAQAPFTTFVSVQADADHAELPTMTATKLIVSMLHEGELVLIPQYACDVTISSTAPPSFSCKAQVRWATTRGLSIIHISCADAGNDVTAAFPLDEGTHPLVVVRGPLRYMERNA
jgi:hypothetical protein